LDRKHSWVTPVVITAAITALLASGITYLLTRPTQKNVQIANLQARVEALENEKETLATENGELESQVAQLEEEVEQLRNQGQAPAPVINRQPKPGWEAYFPTPETTTLTGESVARVRELLGEPPVLIRSIAVNPQFNREVWVFSPFEQDPTGLYLFFKGGQLVSSRLDEFPGLYGSGLLDDEGFWLN